MQWNWQRPDWPELSWQRSRLARAEAQFLVGGGVFIGSVSQLGVSDTNDLTVSALSFEAITTSEIEGEILDRASVQSSIRRQLGLETDKRRINAAEQGIAEMMVDLHRSFERPLSDDMLFAWHRMLTASRRDLKDIGAYRRYAEPMQIISGPLHAPHVHFEAPPSAGIPSEMAYFIDWFNRTGPWAARP
jgi:Fic family protein